MNFSDLNLNKNLMKGIEDARFIDCLPVQERTYEHTLQGRDVIVQSQTGSGKTAAFLVSIYQLFTEDSYKKLKRALIIAPTRELAVQIEDEAKLLGAHLPFRTGCFYGGVGYERQEHLLKKGVDIVIGTPGRLIDLNQSRKLSFNDIGILVIDEADRLFDMGFLPDLRRMLRKMPDISLRQTMLFSATLTSRVRELAIEYMSDPVEIRVEPEKVTVETVTQKLYHVDRSEKTSLLLGLLKKENPSSALIFTNMKSTAVQLAGQLAYNGFGCEYIIGDLPQQKRLKIINGMKSGKIRILVATDVAARGLHINDLELVVNYDLPEDPEAFVHRIGRTARVGKKGKAIAIVCDRYVYGLEAIESLINKKIPVEWAEEEDYVEDKSAGVHFPTEQRGQAPRRRNKRAEKFQHAGNPRPKGKWKKSKTPKPIERREAEQKSAPSSRQGARKEKKKRLKQSQGDKGARTPELRRQDEQAVPKVRKQHHREDRKQTRTVTSREQSLDDRLDFYRKKYGESFTSAPKPKKRKREKILDAIKGIFSRKPAKNPE